jgi:hypothetical protein
MIIDGSVDGMIYRLSYQHSKKSWQQWMTNQLLHISNVIHSPLPICNHIGNWNVHEQRQFNDMWHSFSSKWLIHTWIEIIVCIQLPDKFCSYPAAVTTTGDRPANLDLCKELMALAVRVLLRVTPTALRNQFVRPHPKDRNSGPKAGSNSRNRYHQIFMPPL